MKRILILYASSTGNTEEIAFLLNKSLNKEQFEVTLKNLEMEETEAKLLLEYDGSLFGTYTYDDGNLPFETEVFSDFLETIDLDGKVIGLFGSGDTSYSHFCQAVEEMKEIFGRTNAFVIGTTVKIDLDPHDDEDFRAIEKLAEEFQHVLSISSSSSGDVSSKSFWRRE